MQVQLRPRVASAVSGVLLCLAALLAAAAPAQAHAELLSTTPKNGSTVKAPSVVVLQFDEPVLKLGLTVQVTGPTGRVDDGTARLAGAGVLQPLKPGLAAGSYRVLWRVTSDDGHPVQGAFGFTAKGRSGGGGAAPTGARPTRTASPDASSAAPSPASSPSGSAAQSTDGPLPATIAATPTSGTGSTSTRWTVAGIAIVLLALIAAVIAARRPRMRRPPPP